jgi:hypothetical protein
MNSEFTFRASLAVIGILLYAIRTISTTLREFQEIRPVKYSEL